MSASQKIKKCANPECLAIGRVYVNGHTHCEICRKPLVITDIGFTQSSVDLLQSVSDLKEQVTMLVANKSK